MYPIGWIERTMDPVLHRMVLHSGTMYRLIRRGLTPSDISNQDRRCMCKGYIIKVVHQLVNDELL